MGNYGSIQSMMGKKTGVAPVPTQSFEASNIFGTAVPQVGDSKARPNYAGGAGGGISTKQVIFVAIFLIGVGYLLYHLSFEK